MVNSATRWPHSPTPHSFARSGVEAPMTAHSLPLADSTVVHGACPHDCPDTCAMLVTVENGRAVRVAGDPDHPFTRGFLCTKVNRYVERTRSEERRVGKERRMRRAEY